MLNLKYIVVNTQNGDEGSAYPQGKPKTYHVPESLARMAENLNIQYCNALCAKIIYRMVHK